MHIAIKKCLKVQFFILLQNIKQFAVENMDVNTINYYLKCDCITFHAYNVCK